jgi:two-component system response regulator AdeR
VTRPNAPNASRTVLICEDDSNLRTLVRLALGDGYRIFEAADGNAALDLIRSVEPDLIVLDLMLPGRSGLDLLAEIRRVDGATPVVVISAWAHSDEAAVAAGADRFVAKPFDPNDLQATVLELLENNGNRG